MIAIIIGTHGKYSEQLLKTSEMIFGKQENISTVTFETGEGVEDLVKKYNLELEKLDCKKGVLFLVDLFGGSPFNAASRVVTEVKDIDMDIVTGVNLPMLLEVYGARGFADIKELVDISENGGNGGIKSFKKSFLEQEEEIL